MTDVWRSVLEVKSNAGVNFFPRIVTACILLGMSTLDQILDAAQLLTSRERAQLIAALWDNVAPSEWVPPEPQWIAEANRRSEAYDAGQMTAATWDEVRERARCKAGLDG